MSSILHLNAETGSTYYAVFWNEAGEAWDGTAFVTYTTTRSTFDQVLSEVGVTGLFTLVVSTLPEGYTFWNIYKQDGGSPDHSDIRIATGGAYWDGTEFTDDAPYSTLQVSSSGTNYAVFWNAAGLAWNGTAFATYTTVRSTFSQALTQIGSTGLYRLAIPAVPEGYIYWEIFNQVGGSPSHLNDLRISTGSGEWSGTEITGGDATVIVPGDSVVHYVQPGASRTKGSQRVFYELTRSDGRPIDFYYGLVNTTDLDTGEVTTAKTRLHLRRVVITSLSSKYKAYAASDSKYLKDDTIILIDIRDLPTYEQETEDYFVHNAKQYNIISYELIEREGHVFVVRNVQKEAPAQEIVINIRHSLTMGEVI